MQNRTISGKNKRGNFLVSIQYCENFTWQGYVVWAEENKKEYFHSALELMGMIQDALDESMKEPMEFPEESENQTIHRAM